MALTTNQQLAVDMEGRSILLNAGAGSGKTHVLTERVVRMLTRGDIQADEVLVLTFTKAAAREMKNRISSKMQLQLEKTQAEMKTSGRTDALIKKEEFLERQIAMLPSASIQTIDSFCSDVVRQNHALVGLPANVLMVQDLDQARMKNDILDQMLSDGLNAVDSVLKQTLQVCGGPARTKREIRRLSDKLSSFDDREQWEKASLQAWKEDSLEQTVNRTLETVLWPAVRKFQESAGILASDPEQKPATVKYLTEVADKASRLMQKITDGQVGCLTFQDFDFAQKNSARIADTGWQKDIKKTFSDAKKTLKEYSDIGSLKAEQIRRMRMMRPVMEKLIVLTGEFDKRYRDLKKSRGLMDFTDLEAYALQILQMPMISDQYRKQYRQVFVDEYQDTNPVQEKIITKVAMQDNLFCVGDMKQSIYRFRSADPLLFKRRSRLYQNDSSKGTVINLFQNFRSTTNVLNCCDDIFSRLADQSRELEYGEGDRLQVGREVQGTVEPTRLITYEKTDVPEGEDASKMESEGIAGYVLERMQRDIFDPELNKGKGGMRPCRWSDFAVIGRKRTEFLASLMDVLKKRNIPFSLDKSGPLLKTMEVEMLIQILGLTAGYEDDFAVQNTLRNGFFDFTDYDLVSLSRKEGYSYMDRIRSAAKETDSLAQKCRNILDFFSELRRRDDSQPLSDVISWAADAIDFRTWCTALGDGKQRLANVDLLIQMASDFQRDGRNRLHAFLTALKSLDPELDTIESAKTPAGRDSVLLTTIHGSKGMQYPIVIIPFAGKNINAGTSRMDTCISVGHDINHPENHSVSIPYIDPEHAVSGSILLNDQIRAANKEKSLEEERRLLYVAMTRAQEELVITGEKPEEGKTAVSLMGWILNALNCTDHPSGEWKKQDLISLLPLHEEAQKEEQAKVPHTPLIMDPDFFEPEDMVKSARDTYPVPVTIGASRAASLLAGRKMGIEENPFQVIRSEEQMDEDADHLEAAQRGIKIHSFMEQADFSQILHPGYVEEEAARMFGKDQKVIDPDKIRTLFSQPEAQLITSADLCIREKNGSLLIPFSSLASDYQGPLQTKIQAVIDLVVKNSGKWYLFDYKSDTIPGKPGSPFFEKTLQEHTAHHQTQMDLYRKVLKDNFDIDIEGSWLAYTDISRFVPVYQRQK